MSKTLEVGDVLYSTGQWSDELTKHTIGRVTAKRAFSKHTKFVREPRPYAQHTHDIVGGSYAFISNPVIDAQYNEQQALVVARKGYERIDMYKLTADQLQRIVAIANEPKK